MENNPSFEGNLDGWAGELKVFHLGYLDSFIPRLMLSYLVGNSIGVPPHVLGEPADVLDGCLGVARGCWAHCYL